MKHSFENILLEEIQGSFRFVLFSSIFYGIIFWTQIHFNLFNIYSLAIFSFVAIFIIVKPKIGIYAFIFFSILSETHFLYGTDFFNSIYTYNISSFALIDILIFLLIIRTIPIILMETKSNISLSDWDIGFIVIAFLLIVSSLWGLIFNPTIRNWLVDIKSILFFVIPFFIVRFYFDNMGSIIKLFKIFILLLFAKTLVYFIGYLIQFSISEDLVIRVSLTSDTVFYPLLILFCLAFYLINVKSYYKLLIGFFASITFLSLFWSFGREAWLWTAISLIAFYIISETTIRKNMLKIVIIFIFVSALSITIIRPQTWKYAILSIESFSLTPKGKGEKETGAIRAIEWINIHKLLIETNTILTGRGLGSTWTDRYYSLPKRFDVYSFPLEETEHVFTHMVFSKFYLKFGIIGSLIFWTCLIIPWYKTIIWSKNLPSKHKYLILSILIGSIGVFAKLELVRIAIISGAIFGGISSLITTIENKKYNNINLDRI